MKRGASRVSGPTPKSIMYSGGTIRPLKCGKVDEIVEAIGFHQGKVVAAGTKAAVTYRMDQVCSQYTKASLRKGQALLPGLIEPHVHIMMAAMMKAAWNDFGPFDGQNLRYKYDTDWLKAKIASAKDSITRDFWILGHSVDPSLMPFKVIEGDLNELQTFDCDTVDDLEKPDDPSEKSIPLLMISASGHSAYVNTAALRLIYETKSFDFPDFESFREHVNSRGGLQEIEEIVPALGAIPQAQIFLSVVALTKGLRSFFELAGRRGVTMLYEAAMDPVMISIFDVYFLQNQPSVRIGYAQLCNSLNDAKKFPPYEPPCELRNLFQGSVKIVSDGSNQGLTGHQHKENFYRCKPEHNTGIFNFETDEFNAMVKTVIDKKWPMMIQSCQWHHGDRKDPCSIREGTW